MGKIISIPSKNPILPWQESLEYFLTFKRANRLRDSTLGDYKRFTKQFFSRYPDCWPDRMELRLAAIDYLSQKMKPSTYNLRLSYLRGLFDWCIEEGILTDNPMKGFKVKKTDHRDVDIAKESLRKLIEAPDRKTFVGARDYALILLTLDTGIRPKEAFSLLLDDVNFPPREVYIRPEVSKTKVSRTLDILSATADAIKELLKKRDQRWGTKTPIFCSQDGLMLNKDSWNDRLETYSRRIGDKVRPYDLRHQFALMFIRNGGDAFRLQKMMGHSTMDMTRRYVNLAQSDLKEQHDQASPLRGLIPMRERVGRRGGSDH